MAKRRVMRRRVTRGRDGKKVRVVKTVFEGSKKVAETVIDYFRK